MMEKKMIKIGKIQIKAIVLGFLVDTAGSLFLGLVFGITWLIVKLSQGITLKELQKYPLPQDFLSLIVSVMIGFGCTVLGGYVAGRISKESQVLHGGVVGGLGVILGVIFYSAFPIWFNVVGFLGTIPTGMLGGYLANMQIRKSSK